MVASRPHVLMLLVNNAYPFDGRVPNEARSLVDAGYRVSVISTRAAGQPAWETIEGVEVHRFRLPGEAKSAPGYAFEFVYTALASLVLSLRLLRSPGFDVVHVHNPPDTLGLVAAPLRLLGKRVVFDHHDLSVEMAQQRFPDGLSRIVRRVLAALESLCCRVAHVVIVTNESYRTYDIERHGVDPERVFVVRNGPAEAFFEAVEPDLRMRQGAGAVIGYVGTIGYQDGLEYLLRAVRHLVVDLGRNDLRAVVIGDGDALANVKDTARELGVDEYIRFTGRLEGAAVTSSLASADVCVVPDPSNSYNDRSTMIKVMEYMALGKPIVAFDLPENRVSAGDAAVYVPPNDELGFARAVSDLIDDPQRCAAMGAAGRKRVENALRWSYSVPRLLDAYAQLLERAPA